MAARRTNQASFTKGKGPAKNSKPGKKHLPEPTHVGHFVSLLVVSLCRRILHIDTSVKIGVYLCGTLIGSLLADVFVFPKSYFSDKRNILNRVFVKFGFGWTLLLLLSYILLTSLVFTCGNWKEMIRKHLLRLGVATAWWYAMTKSFVYLDSVVGVCSVSNHAVRDSCLKAGKLWLGFDISGHVFLLIHNLLTISEEVKSFKYWNQLQLLLNQEETKEKRNLTEAQINQANSTYRALTPFIKLNILILTFWTVVCEFMLIVSVVYRFHTLTQKVTACILAVGCWFISYRVLYRTGSDFLPSQPGQSTFNYMKVK